jgi:hypothetical protein
MKGFVGILRTPPEMAYRLKPVVIAESVQGLARDVELEKVERFWKVKNRRFFKIDNTGRARGELPFRDEPSANP